MRIDPTTPEMVLEILKSNSHLGRFIDESMLIPRVFRGNGKIRLIILGQDPTVKSWAARQDIMMVLNLNKSGNLTHYIRKVCSYLGIDLYSEVYATNLYKNFFVSAPTQIKEINIFEAFLPYWLPVLQEELAQFPGIPVLILGEPLLATLVTGSASNKVRDYWGYSPNWKKGDEKPFQVLTAKNNILKRTVFPYPHQPSWQRKKFYSGRLERYSLFVKPYLSQSKQE